MDAATLALNFGVPTASSPAFPQGETYINQGEVIALDSDAARAFTNCRRRRAIAIRLMAEKPWRSFPGGTLHLASAREFPMSATMTGLIIRLRPGAMQELHWHPNASEWFYISKGGCARRCSAPTSAWRLPNWLRATAATSRRAGVIRSRRSDSEPCEIVSSLNDGIYQHSSVSDWIAKVPRHVLRNNLNLADTVAAQFPQQKVMIAGGA